MKHVPRTSRRLTRRFILDRGLPRLLAATLTITSLGAQAGVLTWDITPGVAGPGNNVVNGGTGTWDLAAVNWTADGGANNLLWTNDPTPHSAIFGDLAGTVTVVAPISVNAVTFNSAGYTIGGAALSLDGTTPTITANAAATISSVLGGTTGLVKTGTGTLTLTGANTYAGGTTISAGILQLGNGTANGTLGAGNYAIASDATLRLNYLTAVTPTWSRFSGAGTIALASAQGANGAANWGALTIPAAYTGKLVVENGRVDLIGQANLGGTTAIDIRNGAQILFFAGTYTVPISIAGTGWGEVGYPGGLRLAGGNTATWAGSVTLTANSGFLSQDGGANFTITGPISGNFENDFTSNGTMTITPAGAVPNTYGSTKISGTGNVIAGNAGAFSAGPLTMNSGSLRMNGYSFSFANLSGTAGTIQNFAAAASTITVGADGTSTTYGGRFINGGTGSLGLTKVGGGTLILTGANAHTGPTVISAGTIQYGDGTIGRDGTVGSGTMENNGSLSFNLFGSTGYFNTISGTGSLIKSGPGTLSLGNLNTYGGTTTVASGILYAPTKTSIPGYSTPGKVSVGAGGTLAVGLGAGKWSIADFEALGSTVSFAPGASVGIDTTGTNITYTNLLPSTLGFAKLGGNALTFNGSVAQNYSGPTAVNGGSMVLDFANLATPTNMLNGASPLSLGGGTLSVVGKPGAVTTSQTFASLNLPGSGPSAVVLTNNGTNVALNITGGAFTRTTGNTLSFTIPTGGTVAWDAPLTNGILGPWATVNAEGTVKYATTLGGNIVGFAGTTVATAPEVTGTGHTANFELGAAGAVTAAAQINTLRYTGPTGTLTNAFSSNGLMNVGTGTLTLSGIQTIGNSRELVITGSSNIAMSAAIANNAAGGSGLTYNGTGVLSLGGLNTFSGPLTINSGVVANTRALAANNASQAIGTSGLIILNGGTFRHATTNASLANYIPTIQVGPNGGTLDYANGFVFYQGALTGSGTLTVTNSLNTASAWMLYTGASPAFTGNIVIGNGVGTQSGLQIRSASIAPLGNVPITVNVGGILTGDAAGANSSNVVTLNGGTIGGQNQPMTYNGPINVVAPSTIATPETLAIAGLMTFNGPISGSAALTKTTGNTGLLNAANPYSGTMTIAQGTIRLGNSAALENASVLLATGALSFDTSVVSRAFTIAGLAGTGTVALQDNATVPNAVTLTLGSNGAPSALYAGTLSGIGGITKVGGGGLTLSGGGITYAGATTVTSGSMKFSDTTALGTGPLSVSGSSTITLERTATDWTFGKSVSGTSTLVVEAGVGMVTMSSESDFSGSTTVSTGTLVLSGELSASPVTVLDTATIKGPGTVVNSLTIASGGRIEPGAGVGTLVAGSLLLSTGSLINFDLNGADRTVGGVVNDLLFVAGNLTLDGSLNVTDVGSGTFLTATNGNKWRLLDYSGTLTNNGLNLGTLPDLSPGLSFAIDTATAGQINLAVVPEPGAAISLIGGLGMLLGLRRRRA